MKKADLQEYRDRLMALRSRLKGDVSRMADAALKKGGEGGRDLSSMPIHMADLGSDNFEQDFTLTLMETEEGTLNAVEDALARMEEGSYGLCEDCKSAIPKLRLNAIPYTNRCVKCAAKAERG